MKNWITLCFLFLFHPLIGLSQDPSLAHSVNVVLGEWQESAVDLQSPGPKALQLKRAYPHIGLEGIPEGWRFSFPNVGLAATKKPLEKISETIRATYDKEHRLVSIIQNDPANFHPLHRFFFSYANNGSQQLCTVTTDQGESIRYHWYAPSVKEGEGGPILQKVSFSDGTSIHYHYTLQAKTRRNLLNRRIDPSGSSVEITRYTQGKIILPVSLLRSKPRMIGASAE